MDKRERLKQLQDEARQLSEGIARQERTCKHSFPDEPVYDPIETPRMEFSHYEGHGSDPNPVYHKAGTDSKPRWKRTCVRCGKVEYTEKRKTTATSPDFG
jgi:hypothetical protein